MVKVGIHGKAVNCSTYVRARYGKGTVHKWGIRFNRSLRSLKTVVETPVLKYLKSRGDLCTRVTGKKEHFWVKTNQLPEFIGRVKYLVNYYSQF